MKYTRVVSGLLVAMLFFIVYMIMSDCQGINGLHRLATQISALKFERSPNENKSQELASPNERQEEANGPIVHRSKEQEVRGHQNTSNRDGPSLEHEVARRQVERVSEEFKIYVHAKLLQMKKQALPPNIVKEVDNILDISGDIHKKLKSDQSRLANAVDGAGEWRKRENLRLTNLIQRRLEYIQNKAHMVARLGYCMCIQQRDIHGFMNPSDCDKAKKIFCKMLNDGHGYGSQMHHVTYCLFMAYATQRTLILKSEGWGYAPKGWETVFLPISRTCPFTGGQNTSKWGPNSMTDNAQVIELSQMGQLSWRPRFLPLAIPEDIADNLTRVNGYPPAWWIGQFVTYVTRPNAMMQKFLNEGKEKLNFTNPIVGVQVRRTDKIRKEAQFHSVDEYMRHVKEWFDIYEKQQPRVQRIVYIASDDPGVLQEAKKNYPNYTFVSDNEVSKNAGKTPKSRNTETSLRGIILDIYLLSRCDYVVCTFSSNICRAAYELMQPLHGDASRLVKSIDRGYYYPGQNANNVNEIERAKMPTYAEVPDSL